MKQFQIVYDENKKLDELFDKLSDASNKEIIRKNKLELLVELGELANETKCFKYWSKKAVDTNSVREEYADCLIMVLCFFNMLDIKLDENFKVFNNNYDLIDLIGYLYKLCSLFYEKESIDTIKEIFIGFIELGHQLKMSDSDIIKSCLAKIEKNKGRFVSGF